MDGAEAIAEEGRAMGYPGRGTPVEPRNAHI